MADLSATKTGPATVNAGASISYTVVVSNAGPSAADGASFSDTVPAGITGVNASCGSATGGAACGSVSTMGNSVTSTITTLPSGGSVTFTITGTAPASGSLSNTATVAVPSGTTDSNTNNNSSTASTTVSLIADLAITKDNGQATYTPTFPTTYTIIVTNNGPSNASGFEISDAVPAALTGLTINCTATGSASCGSNASSGNNVSFTGASINAGGGNAITITVAGTVSGSTTGTLVNTANIVIPQNATFSDLTLGNNSATDSDGLRLQADLAITKTNNATSVVAGGTTTYTIVVTNNGPNAVTDASVLDTMPSGVTSATWTCIASTGSLCGAASGSGSFNTTVDLLSGGTATFTVVAQISPAATGLITNTATVYEPCGVLDPTQGNNTATDSDPLAGQINLSLDLSVNNPAPEPGQTITYTLTLRNGGPSTATGVLVGDPLPPSLQFVSTNGNYNPQTGIWNVGTIPVGGTVTLTITVLVHDTSAVNRAEVISADQTDVNSTPDNQADEEDDIDQIRFTTPKGPGSPYPGAGAMSDTKAGSILFFNYYTSNAANPNLENTRINITNSHPRMNTIVHLFFVDGATCSVADNYLCLTPNQTASFTAADIDPGVAGYLVAIAVDEFGCPINANCLIGDAYVKTAAGVMGNLAAEAVAALRARPTECDADTSATTIVFDGVSYNRIPRALAIDSIPSREDGNRTFLVLNRIGGNLATGAATIGSLFGLLFNDTESAFSFNISASTCQLRQELSSSFPRTTPRFDQVIGGGRTGWMRIWKMDDGGILGSVMNVNANTAANSSAYAGAHNLHHLTSSTSVSLSIPVFPASCR